jgi:hypothetical protein
VKRPKTTAAGRKELRADAHRQAARRRKIEQQIALGTVKTISWEEATSREEFPDDVLIEEPLSPAEEFIRRRIPLGSDIPPNAELKRVLTELMASGTPMTPWERRWYGDGLRWLKSQRPDRPRAISPKIKALVFNSAIDAYVQRGHTAEQAKSKLVEDCNLASVEALNQLLRRHGKK